MLWTTPGIWPNRTDCILEVWKLLSVSLSWYHDKLIMCIPGAWPWFHMLCQLMKTAMEMLFPGSFSFEKIVNATLTVLKIFHSCPILRNVQQGLQKWITPFDGEIKPSSFQGKVHCFTDGNTTAPYKWDVGSGRNRGGDQGKHTFWKYIGLVFLVFYFALLHRLLLYLVCINYQLFWHRLSQKVIFCARVQFSNEKEGGKNPRTWSYKWPLAAALIKHHLLWGSLACAYT